MKALIIDDDADIRSIARLSLESRRPYGCD